MFCKLFSSIALVMALGAAFISCASYAENAKPTTVANSLIITPKPVDKGFLNPTPFTMYAIYTSTHEFVAAFSTRQAAMAYTQKLVKDGKYASYSYADYDPYTQQEQH